MGSIVDRSREHLGTTDKAVVTSRLLLMKAVATWPGIAGLVWRETCPPGYDLPHSVRHVEQSGRGAIDGSPEHVHARIVEVAATYGTRDVGIVTNCFAFEHRVRSYELVARAFGLTPRD